MIVSTVVNSTLSGLTNIRTAGRCALGLAVALLVMPAVAGGQPSNATDPFAPIEFLIGRWEGTSEGQPGKATVRREYTRVLNSRFIRAENRSEYPVQEKNPKGEVHEMRGGSASTKHASGSCSASFMSKVL